MSDACIPMRLTIRQMVRVDGVERAGLTCAAHNPMAAVVID